MTKVWRAAGGPPPEGGATGAGCDGAVLEQSGADGAFGLHRTVAEALSLEPDDEPRATAS